MQGMKFELNWVYLSKAVILFIRSLNFNCKNNLEIIDDQNMELKSMRLQRLFKFGNSQCLGQNEGRSILAE
jgi:hypothetical protein